MEKERQKEENAKAPLLDLAHTVIYDWAGMPISHIENGENGEKNKLSYGIYRRMLILSFLMQIHIEKMKEKVFIHMIQSLIGLKQRINR